MTPMGEYVGSGLTKSKKFLLLIIICFALGILITIAEPDLTVLANQVKEVISSTALILFVGLGVGIFLVIGVLKIMFKRQLASLLMFFYMLLFALSAILILNGNQSILALAFDSGGVTTGPMSVPFIIAIAVSSNLQGAATLVGDTTSILLAKEAGLDFSDFFVDGGKPGMFWVVQAGAIVSAFIIVFMFRKEKSKIEFNTRTKVEDKFPTFLLLGTVITLIAVSFIPCTVVGDVGPGRLGVGKIKL